MDATTRLLPPLGTTGVEPGHVIPSWFAGTAWPDEPKAWAWTLYRDLQAWLPTGSHQTRNRHYQAGMVADDQSWAVWYAGQGSAAGSVFAEVRQGGWDRLGSAWTAIAPALARWLAPSRIDLALDDPWLRFRPRDGFDNARAAVTRTHRSLWELNLRDLGARTKLTVGSRSSATYLRVYDKADPDRVRHELELKAGAADQAAAAFRQDRGVDDAYLALYRHLVQWPTVPGWVSVLDALQAA